MIRVGLFLILCCGLALAAPAEDIYFLSHEEFLKLPPMDQADYVRQLKIIVSDMVETSQYFAVLASEDRNIASSYTQAPEGNRNTIEMALQDSAANQRIFDRLTALKKSGQKIDESALDRATRVVRFDLVWAGAQARPLTGSEKAGYVQRIRAMSNDFENSLNKNRKYVNSDAQYTASATANIIKNQIGGLGTSVSKTKKIKSKTSNKKILAKTEKATSSETAPEITKASSSEKTVSQKTSASPMTNVKVPVEKAGFVIKGHLCRANEQLPFALTGIDVGTFKCEPPQIICNPLLFGFRSDCASEDFAVCLKSAKPQCTQKAKNATAICGEAARDDKYTTRAVELIKNNKTSYDQFAKDLTDLCDEKNIHESDNLKLTAKNKPRKNYESLVKDVMATCQLAQARLKVVSEAFQKIAKAAPVKPSSSLGSK
jgi:hypothetical protein